MVRGYCGDRRQLRGSARAVGAEPQRGGGHAFERGGRRWWGPQVEAPARVATGGRSRRRRAPRTRWDTDLEHGL